MTWFGWVALVLILGGTAWLWSKMYPKDGGATHCCGCGKCARTGECVMVKGKKTVKKEKDPA